METWNPVYINQETQFLKDFRNPKLLFRILGIAQKNNTPIVVYKLGYVFQMSVFRVLYKIKTEKW